MLAKLDEVNLAFRAAHFSLAQAKIKDMGIDGIWYYTRSLPALIRKRVREQINILLDGFPCVLGLYDEMALMQKVEGNRFLQEVVRDTTRAVEKLVGLLGEIDREGLSLPGEMLLLDETFVLQ